MSAYCPVIAVINEGIKPDFLVKGFVFQAFYK